MIGTRNFTLYPVGDAEEVKRVYAYIKNGQKIYAQMLNIAISTLYRSLLDGEDKEKHIVYKEDGTPKINPKTNKPTERSAYDELKVKCSRTPDSKLGSIYAGKLSMDDYPVGLPLAAAAGRKADGKLKECMKKGLLYGNMSLPTYRKDNPLDFPKMYVTPRGTFIRKNANKESIAKRC